MKKPATRGGLENGYGQGYSGWESSSKISTPNDGCRLAEVNVTCRSTSTVRVSNSRKNAARPGTSSRFQRRADGASKRRTSACIDSTGSASTATDVIPIQPRKLSSHRARESADGKPASDQITTYLYVGSLGTSTN